jgi:hypothetical protein
MQIYASDPLIGSGDQQLARYELLDGEHNSVLAAQTDGGTGIVYSLVGVLDLLETAESKRRETSQKVSLRVELKLGAEGEAYLENAAVWWVSRGGEIVSRSNGRLYESGSAESQLQEREPVETMTRLTMMASAG